jgi:hypothetical protein
MRKVAPLNSEHLKRQIIRLAYARVDMRCATALAELIAERRDATSQLAWGLFTGMAISYARPFTNSDVLGSLESKWSRFGDRADLKKHHDRMIKYRHSLLAHNTLAPEREVIVFPSGHLLAGPVVTETREMIDLGSITALLQLFDYQDARFSQACSDLVRRLEAMERWPSDEEVRLTLS